MASPFANIIFQYISLIWPAGTEGQIVLDFLVHMLLNQIFVVAVLIKFT